MDRPRIRRTSRREPPATLTGPGRRDRAFARMNPAVDERLVAAPKVRVESLSGTELFTESLRRKPVGTSLGLVVEYLTFASAVSLALSLYLTRKPMAFVDRVLGLRLRGRFLELIARISPG
jgi:hypothetical protein